MIFSAQEQALRANYTKFSIDKTIDSPFCRMYSIKNETIYHTVSEYSKIAKENTSEGLITLQGIFTGASEKNLYLTEPKIGTNTIRKE